MAAGATIATTAVNALVGAMKDGVDNAIELDSAMNLMARTTGLEGESLDAMEAEIRDMATSAGLAGIKIEQLTDIGIMGGRMGVDREKLPAFIKDIARVGIALDDIPVEEAAQSIVQILGVFELGAEHSTSFASSLNILSNNAKTTGGAILDVAGRLREALRRSASRRQKMLALATAMMDVGISAEVGGTAMSTILARMAKDTVTFARVAGVSVEEFKGRSSMIRWRRSKLFVGGLQGDMADFSLLEEVGITGARESGVTSSSLPRRWATSTSSSSLSESDWESHASILRDNAFATQQIDLQMEHLQQRLDDVSTDVGSALAAGARRAKTAWVELVEENADGLVESAETLAWVISSLTPIIKGVADVAVRGFGLARRL